MKGKWRGFLIAALALLVLGPTGLVYAEQSVMEEWKDDRAPKVTDFIAGHGAYLKESGEIWYRELPDVIASYTITDKTEEDGSGIKKSRVSVNGVEALSYSMEDSDVTLIEQSKTIELAAADIKDRFIPGKNEVEITAEDFAGNSSTTTKIIGLDDAAPVITEIVMEEKETETGFFGIIGLKEYYKSSIQIVVKVKDIATGNDVTVPGVGVHKIALKLNGETAFTVEKVENNQAVFVVPEILDENQVIEYKKISFEISDKLGNNAEYYAVGSDDSDGSLMIENKKPTVTVEIGKNGVMAPGKGEPVVCYYGAFDDNGIPLIDFIADASEEGLNSGLKQIVAVLNGEIAYENDFEETQLFASYSEKTRFDLSKITVSDNYSGTVTVTDKAGNATSLALEIQKDSKGAAVGIPEITEPFSKGINVLGYRDSVTITVTPTDEGAGASAIEWGILAADGGEERKAVIEINEKGKAAFSIYAPAEETYAETIYIKAIDKLGNVGDAVVLDRILIEKQTVHDKKAHVVNTILTKTPYLDENGYPLFDGSNRKIVIKTDITDTENGISSIEWSVKSESASYANLGGKVVIDNGVLMPVEGVWSIDEGSDFAAKVSGEIEIDTDGIDANHVVVSITMTDLSGNQSTKEIAFSVDRTAPEITVIFDDVAADPEYTNVYRESRKATITVIDRNFGKEQLVLQITNTKGAVPELSEWTTTVNTEHPAQTISTATIVFSEEGDYSVRIDGADLAGQAAETVNVEEFIIDKTKPVITVTYTNDNVKNGNYYADTQTAVIQIVEHNFAEERIEIIGVANEDETAVTFPALSTWSNDGDRHTATLTFDADAFYQFTVDYRDKAGNEAERYVGEEFYIDKTTPLIAFRGVEDGSANNGVVAPEISITDSNYDTNGITIDLYGVNHGTLKPDGVYSTQSSGQIFTFYNFPEEQSNDDIYTVTVTATDLAGNETKEELTFSVNRFGSVYVFDSSLKKIAGSYVQEEIDVRLTEVNVDSLEHDTIRVVVDTNGTISDLKEGIDYTVVATGGNGGWYQYDYTIDKSLFSGDGRYIITLYSKDAAGNMNANIDESKEAEISFGIDKTPPVVIPVDITSEKQYALEEKTATVAISDNLILENVEVYINDVKCEYEAEGENYIFHVQSSNSRQDIMVAAEDSAGNRTNYVISGVLVTTNAFIRWYHNTPLFAGSIAGAAAISGAGIGGFVYRKKRRVK